jgi:hypothetical protein
LEHLGRLFLGQVQALQVSRYRSTSSRSGSG